MAHLLVVGTSPFSPVRSLATTQTALPASSPSQSYTGTLLPASQNPRDKGNLNFSLRTRGILEARKALLLAAGVPSAVRHSSAGGLGGASEVDWECVGDAADTCRRGPYTHRRLPALKQLAVAWHRARP